MADLTTLATVKARLAISDGGDDALLAELISEASDWIQLYTGRQFTPTSTTYVVDTSAGPRIQVRRGIRAVTALSIASTDQPDTGGTYSAIAASLIALRPSPLQRRDGWPATSILLLGATGPLSTAVNGASITGDFGWAAIPPAIAAVAIQMVLIGYQVRKRGTAGAIGAESAEVETLPWREMLGSRSPAMRTLGLYRGVQGIA